MGSGRVERNCRRLELCYRPRHDDRVGQNGDYGPIGEGRDDRVLRLGAQHCRRARRVLLGHTEPDNRDITRIRYLPRRKGAGERLGSEEAQYKAGLHRRER